MKIFAGKAVLVTGGGSGMGRATAELLAQRGASVCVMGRRADKLDDVVRAICHEGGQALAVQGDTSKPEDVENAVARTLTAFGALRYAVNNAGISGTFVPTADMLDVWRHTISINLDGVFYGLKYQILSTATFVDGDSVSGGQVS